MLSAMGESSGRVVSLRLSAAQHEGKGGATPLPLAGRAARSLNARHALHRREHRARAAFGVVGGEALERE